MTLRAVWAPKKFDPAKYHFEFDPLALLFHGAVVGFVYICDWLFTIELKLIASSIPPPRKNKTIYEIIIKKTHEI